MSAKVLKKEGYKVELEMHIGQEEFEQGVGRAYHKMKNKFNVPGFRKGKAPRYMIERIYGEGVLYEEAINILFPDSFQKAIEETGIEPVDRPHVDIKELDAKTGVVILATVDVKPEVALGAYKGLEIVKIDGTVTDDEVQKALEAEAEKNSRMVTVEDRPVEKDDIVIMDFEGFLDGVPFEGGKGENHELKIGSNSFIPGFEDQITGKNTGEAFDVHVTFPEEYHAENLKGRETVFKVTVHEIKRKELPLLDDEFAKDVSEFDTLEEYRADLRQKLGKDKEKNALDRMKDEAVGKAVDSATVEIPNAMVQDRIGELVQDLEMRLRYQGMNLEKYLEMTRGTMDQLMEQYHPIALSQVKTRLVLEAIAKAEGILAEEGEKEEKVRELSETYKMSPEEFKEKVTPDFMEHIGQDIIFGKTVDFIYDSARQGKAPAKKKSKEAAADKKETVKSI
ncbi:MAG: trigger factor [Clostridia bacterium]